MAREVMIFAAGKGSRMLFLTNSIPKPLLKLRDKSLIEHNLNFVQSHIKPNKVVINVSYLRDIMKAFISEIKNFYNFEIIISEEEEILGLGGGLANAVKYFQNDYIYTLNSDSFIYDKNIKDACHKNNFLDRFESLWQPKIMDCLKLLISEDKVVGKFNKDYCLLKNNKTIKENNLKNESNLGIVSTSNSDLMYTGVQILKLDNFRGKASNSYADLDDILQDQNKILGYREDSQIKFFHCNTKEDLEFSEKVLSQMSDKVL